VLAGCSRPPCRCDFPRCTVPIGSGGPRCGPRRAAADAGRWAGGFLGLLLQFGSSALASSGNKRELLCSSPNRVGHLLSSTPRGAPATHRLPVTHVADASPLLGLALRLWLHGSPRFTLAVLGRVERAANVIAADVCRPRSVHPGRPAQPSLQPTALSLRFSMPRVPTASPVYSLALTGRPAELLRWAGGFLGLRLQSVCSARASTSDAQEPLCPSPNRVSHLLSSPHRGAPATHRLPVTHVAYASPLCSVALRSWLHGSPRLMLAVPVRVQGAAKVVAGGVCRPKRGHPCRPAQHLLQPTALSLRFFILVYADRS
jgi:hypothetical protein